MSLVYIQVVTLCKSLNFSEPKFPHCKMSQSGFFFQWGGEGLPIISPFLLGTHSLPHPNYWDPYFLHDSTSLAIVDRPRSWYVTPTGPIRVLPWDFCFCRWSGSRKRESASLGRMCEVGSLGSPISTVWSLRSLHVVKSRDKRQIILVAFGSRVSETHVYPCLVYS